ncbi:MAG: LPS assembly protein LptD [Gammaproteobacteria bacterium]|nr:LPS assembly protein LptD [Gammaproteobacteria bacterium]
MLRIKATLLLSLSLIISTLSVDILAQSGHEQWNCLPLDSATSWNCISQKKQVHQTKTPAAHTHAHTPTAPQSTTKPAAQKKPVVQKQSSAETICHPIQRGEAQTIDNHRPLQIKADEVSGNPEQQYQLKGNIKIDWNDKQLRAQQALYQIPQTNILIEGELQYQDNQVLMTGRDGQINTLSRQGKIKSVEYQFRQTPGRGTAETLSLTGPGKMSLEQASYTTCATGNDHWLLKASKVDIDQNEGKGYARNARIEFMNIPLLYTPYISFPIDDRRKSGFLTPSWGSSSQTGADIRIPWYWNISANRDVTITPRLLGRRGLQLQGEMRYLNKTSQGRIAAAYLPSDAVLKENRSLFSLQHTSKIGSKLTTTANLSTVSDETYFEDLGNNLGASSRTYLEQTLATTLSGNNWSLTGRVQNYQNLDSSISNANESYQRLPQIMFSTDKLRTGAGLEYQIQADLTHFYKKGQISGNRLILEPSVQYPMQGNFWFIKPTARLHSSLYRLDNNAPGASKNIQRNIPGFSLDSGLFLERNLTIQQQALTHTIEPRIFYTRTPKRDQSQIPIFDSGLLDINQPQLFAANRFSGNDRIADANQLTLSLGSRLLQSDTGEQLVSFNIGQIIYFSDRTVTLPGQAIETTKSSSIITEFDARLSSTWKMDSSLYWNPDDNQTKRGDIRFQYRPDQYRLFNLAYRFYEQQMEQINTSMVWPINGNWNAIANWNYSLRDRHLTEGLAGLEYDSCCWSLRLLFRDYINNSSGENNTAFYLQLQLKGLGNIGKPIESLLARSILGYQEH